MLKLFYSPGACSLASHIALEEAGANYVAQKVDLKSNEQRSDHYLAINPKGRVPVLVTSKGVLTENPAILEYIARTHPESKLIDLHDEFAVADVQAFNIFLTSTVHIAFAHVFRPTRYGEGEDVAAAMKAKAKSSLDEYFGLIEQKLADGRPYVHGDSFSISDPYLLVFSRWLDRAHLGPVDKFPLVSSHRKRLEDRKAIRLVLEVESRA